MSCNDLADLPLVLDRSRYIDCSERKAWLYSDTCYSFQDLEIQLMPIRLAIAEAIPGKMPRLMSSSFSEDQSTGIRKHIAVADMRCTFRYCLRLQDTYRDGANDEERIESED